MPEIEVFDMGQRPIMHEGWPVPWERGNILWYEVPEARREGCGLPIVLMKLDWRVVLFFFDILVR